MLTPIGAPWSRPKAVAATATFALVLFCATGVCAEDVDSLEDITVMGWALNNVRVSANYAPDYIGSNDYSLQPSGAISVYKRGSPPTFGAPDDGLNLGIAGTRLSAGVSGRWRSGRSDKHDLSGFDKIDWAVEAGVFANWWPADWLRIHSELRHGFNGHHGWVADLGADAVAHPGAWLLSVGPRMSWADDDFTRTYFAVSPNEAARSPFGIQAYEPNGSTFVYGGVASAEYRVSPHWSVTAVVNYRRLTGDAADSPIVADLGSKDQFSTAIGVRYWFGR